MNNSDVNYCKMPDGTLLCWWYVEQHVNAADWTAWGSEYYARITPNITWAVPFISAPYIFATTYWGDAYTGDVRGTATQCNDFYAYRARNTDVDLKFNILAVGRWK